MMIRETKMVIKGERERKKGQHKSLKTANMNQPSVHESHDYI